MVSLISKAAERSKRTESHFSSSILFTKEVNPAASSVAILKCFKKRSNNYLLLAKDNLKSFMKSTKASVITSWLEVIHLGRFYNRILGGERI